MDNLLTINCSCGLSFSITSKNLKHKDKIVCPNCDVEVPKEIVDNLKAIVNYNCTGVYEGSNFVGLRHSLQFNSKYETPKKS